MQTERFLEKRHVPRVLTEPVCVGVPSLRIPVIVIGHSSRR
jgi:hypothetical protein